MSKGEETKKRIIEIATELFFEKGLNQVTFAQIGKKAGLTQPALYKYFEDKVFLLAHCCTAAAEDGRSYIRSKVRPMLPPRDQLEAYFLANLEWFHRNRPKAYALLSMYYFAHSSDLMDQVRLEIEKNGQENIAILLRQINSSKNPNIDEIQNLARLIHSLLVGEIFKMFYQPSVMSIKNRGRSLRDQVFSWLD